jgi:hypothetical protein
VRSTVPVGGCRSVVLFTLAEIGDYKEEVGEGYLGGGTFFEFRLEHFATLPVQMKKR